MKSHKSVHDKTAPLHRTDTFIQWEDIDTRIRQLYYQP